MVLYHLCMLQIHTNGMSQTIPSVKDTYGPNQSDIPNYHHVPTLVGPSGTHTIEYLRCFKCSNTSGQSGTSSHLGNEVPGGVITLQSSQTSNQMCPECSMRIRTLRQSGPSAYLGNGVFISVITLS
jgi:hypothetical protein